LRLQDIARQLADLAQKERRSATIKPAEPEMKRTGEDEEAFARVLERIDDTERQTVEALTAVNERLTMLAQQIAVQPRAEPFVRPEDVPGYSALESAIRNVVEHIEVSEKRTRDSLKAMQDR
jgi:localization factor PodJL